MKKTSGEIKRLQDCINDLIIVVSLPAIWKNFDTLQIVQNLMESLVRMLRLDFGYARLNDSTNGPYIEIIDLFQHEKKSIQPPAVGQKLNKWLAGNPPSTPVVITNPVGAGTVSMTFFRLGVEGEIGLFAVGSGRKDFPTRNEMLILHVAANQATLGLQEARVLSKQKQATEEFNQKTAERSEQLTAVNEELNKEVSERKRAEEELRRSETYLAEGQKLSHTASWAWNVSTGDIFWSKELYRIFGLDPDSVKPGYPMVLQYIHPDDRFRAQEIFENAVSRQRDYELAYRVVREDGTIRYVNNIAHPVFDKSGTLTEYVGTTIDNTERIVAEEALKASNEKLQILNKEKQASNESLQFLNEKLQVTAEELKSGKDKLLDLNDELERKVAEVSLADSDLRNFMDSTQIGTIFLDRGLRIKRYTPQIEKLFNILPSDIDQPLEHFTHRLDHLNLQEDARQVLADLKNVEREMLSKDRHWYIVRLLPYRTQEDKIDGVVVTFVEITERKRTEEALQKAQAELAHVTRVTTLGEVTASIAHEVNQPLGAIVINGQACLRLLARNPIDLNEAREAVECTINDALRASKVIKGIRALLKKTAPEKSLLDINETIQEVIRMVSRELIKNQILLRTELEKNLPPVLGDRIQLQQVVLNLILNAKDAMSSKGWKPRELSISAEKSEIDKVMVTVRDSGKGLDPKISERLFDAFFTTKKKTRGLGLGLSISRTIIEAHGGRLWSAPNVDKGATFRFTIPTSDENHL